MRNWELHVHFKVHGKGTELFGDGFSIWYTRERSELGTNTILLFNLIIIHRVRKFFILIIIHRVGKLFNLINL